MQMLRLLLSATHGFGLAQETSATELLHPTLDSFSCKMPSMLQAQSCVIHRSDLFAHEEKLFSSS